MARNGSKRDSDGKGIGNESKRTVEDQVDALFQLSLAEFTGARNSLAARLKKEGRPDDAEWVKALAKPSISAWAVNQLHWRYRAAFAQLLTTGQRFRQAQSSRKMADMRTLLDARRETLAHLSDLAAESLRAAGHNPTPDMIHRINTTLQAVSAYDLADGPTLGRLTEDVDPPGFESLAGLVPGISIKDLSRAAPAQKSSAALTPKARPGSEVQKPEEKRRAQIAAAKATLQEARKSLTAARSWAQRLETAQKKAAVEAKESAAKARQADKQLREAEERFKKASVASEAAAQRAKRTASEAEEAAEAMADAERNVEEAAAELESVFQSAT
jgi:hypothetical protein